jgi:hypothetical protein
MNTSVTIKAISVALLFAQKAIGAAKKDSSNPFSKSKYANLGSVINVCKKPLNDNGVTVLQLVGSNETSQYLETILLHESGEFIGEKMVITPAKSNDPQAQGSAISYAKRYALQAMLFIPSEDDDAERATDHQPVVKQNLGTIDPADVMDRAMVKQGVCKKCGAKMVKSPSTGNWFCSAKCWTK